MVRCWIYSAGPDQCQCYNVDDENLADLAAQAQFLEDFRAQRAANPALYRQLLNMLVPAADAQLYRPAVLTASVPAARREYHEIQYHEKEQQP